MQPLAFYRSLFCLSRTLAPLRCPAPVHLDGVDHHPYGAPNAGVLRISRQLPAGNWIRVARIPVGARQVFVTNLALKGPAVLRATVGSSTSLPWREGG